MEIPCILTFNSEDIQLLEKAKELLGKRGFKCANQGPKERPMNEEKTRSPRVRNSRRAVQARDTKTTRILLYFCFNVD